MLERLQKSITRNIKSKIRGEKNSHEEAFLLVFSAEWCGPSKRFKKEIESAGITCYTLIDVDLDENQDLSEKFSVRSIPMTFLINKKGEVINKWSGYDDEDPGQTKFVEYINSCPFSIIPFKNKTL